MVAFTRPRGYFDPPRDTMRLDGQTRLPGVTPGAGVASSRLRIEALRLGRNSALHLGYANRFMAINALSAMVRVVRSMLGGREAAAAWLEIGDEAERQIANIVLRKDPGSWVGAAPYPQHLTTEAHLLARGWAARRRWRDLSSRVPGDQLLAMVSAPGSTDASGLVSSSVARTDGAAAQCVAGLLAVATAIPAMIASTPAT